MCDVTNVRVPIGVGAVAQAFHIAIVRGDLDRLTILLDRPVTLISNLHTFVNVQ